MSTLLLVGAAWVGLVLLVGLVAMVVGLPKSPATQKAPRAWQASAEALGLEFSDALILTGSIDGHAVEVKRFKRDANSGMGFQTQARVEAALPEDIAVDTSRSASVTGMIAEGLRDPVTLGDPAFDAQVRVWGDEASARAVLTEPVRTALLEAKTHTRILILGGALIGEYDGLVKDERTLTEMIRATVDVAVALDQR